jgi:hypothetical protein
MTTARYIPVIDDATLLKLWRLRLDTRTIAERLQVSEAQVYNRLSHLKFYLRAPR